MTSLFTHVSGNTYKFVGTDFDLEMGHGVLGLFADVFRQHAEYYATLDLTFVDGDMFVTETIHEGLDGLWEEEFPAYPWGDELLA